MEELISGFKGLFSSPIKPELSIPITANKSKQPISPSNKPIDPNSNNNTNPATKLVFGGKRKSLKRKNKKNNKTKRR